MNWKSRSQAPPAPSSPTDYPSGTVVKTESGTYLIKGKTKLRAYSPKVIKSWCWTPVLGSTESISKFIKAGVLGFRDGSLIKNVADGRIYLISDNKRRWVKDPILFEEMGFDPRNVVKVSDKEANLHSDGEPIE